jgi:hypothetical protein
VAQHFDHPLGHHPDGFVVIHDQHAAFGGR